MNPCRFAQENNLKKVVFSVFLDKIKISIGLKQ